MARRFLGCFTCLHGRAPGEATTNISAETGPTAPSNPLVLDNTLGWPRKPSLSARQLFAPPSCNLPSATVAVPHSPFAAVQSRCGTSMPSENASRTLHRLNSSASSSASSLTRLNSLRLAKAEPILKTRSRSLPSRTGSTRFPGEDAQGDMDQPPRTMLEASARRLARAQLEGTATGGGAAVALAFMRGFMAAVQESRADWAAQDDVAKLLHAEVRMVDQEKRVVQGKQEVITELNQGMDALMKMLGSKKDELPAILSEEPKLVDGHWLITYSFKRGMLKFRIRNEFLIVQNQIKSFRSARA